MSRECSEWLNQMKFPSHLNDTNIVLIPKCANPSTMADLRPIALCNVLYKIISKVLANSLKRILPKIISLSQSAFVLGRLIVDNVLVAFELIHYMKWKNRGNYAFVALKIDINKVYDKIDWSYLKLILIRMGFANRWVNLIMLCVTSVRLNFIVNNQIVGPLTPQRWF